MLTQPGHVPSDDLIEFHPILSLTLLQHRNSLLRVCKLTGTFMGMDKRAAYPLDEASKLAGGISRGTWYNLEARGEIRLVRIGRRVFVPASELERLTSPVEEGSRAHG
jgi:hypothetical protein